MLRRLGLQLTRRRNIGHKRDVDKHRLIAAQIVAHLANCFNERKRFDVTHRPADFAEHKVEAIDIGLCKFLNFIGDVRNDLHSRPQIISAPFLVDDIAVYAARSDIVGLLGGNTCEAFIMAKIEVSLGSIVSHIDFAVLIR